MRRSKSETVGEVDGTQVGFLHHRLRLLLLYDGGQLFLVAYEHKLGDGVLARAYILRREQTYNLGLEYLGGLVDNSQVEMLDRQEGYLTVEGCGGAAEHTATLYHLPDLTAVAARL